MCPCPGKMQKGFSPSVRHLACVGSSPLVPAASRFGPSLPVRASVWRACLRQENHGCNLTGWVALSRKSQKNSFIVKNDNEKNPPKSWVFFMFNLFSSFSSLLFSALVLLFSLCYSYILKPKSHPPSEVTGRMISIDSGSDQKPAPQSSPFSTTFSIF